MKAIHNDTHDPSWVLIVVLYPKDTEKWKQFTTWKPWNIIAKALFCIPKILKNESNSQRNVGGHSFGRSCFVSQRYWKMKAIHNSLGRSTQVCQVVLYPKDTEKWKQFTTCRLHSWHGDRLFCIPKILKNESNSQLTIPILMRVARCFVSQRYWKMKAIHNW